MSMSELELDNLQRKYPGITREDAEGKTEAEIKHTWFQKRFEKKYFSKGYLEMRERVEPALDNVMDILKNPTLNVETKKNKIKEKWGQFKTLSKAVREAREEKNNAELGVCSYDDLNGERSCIICTNVMDDDKPLFVGYKCESFNSDDFCEDTGCSMFTKNARYIRACIMYKLARHARREFIKGLFIRSK